MAVKSSKTCKKCKKVKHGDRQGGIDGRGTGNGFGGTLDGRRNELGHPEFPDKTI